jgi:hypothetical protein
MDPRYGNGVFASKTANFPKNQPNYWARGEGERWFELKELVKAHEKKHG